MSELTDRIPDSARDIRLNLESLFSTHGSPGLSEIQVAGIAMACGYALKDAAFAQELQQIPPTPELVAASKAAASIMAMNNVYYRTLHMARNEALAGLPARLRMNVIAKPGIEKVDFELMCFAVSALSGCESCIRSHMFEVKKAGVGDEGIQSAIRIAAVINGAHTAIASNR